MEAPDPRNATAEEHGFCSEDNTDPTAASLARERARSGLERAAYLRWNIVPWRPVGADGKWRAPRPTDVQGAMAPLIALQGLLPQLGDDHRGSAGAARVDSASTLYAQTLGPLLAVPYPSQRNTTGREESLARWRYPLSAAARCLKDRSPATGDTDQ